MKVPLTLSELAVGVDVNSEQIQGAELQKDLAAPYIQELLSFDEEHASTHSLNEYDQIVVTAIPGRETLVRILTIPLTREKDLIAALPFQLENILPYPVEEALVVYQIIEQKEDTTKLTVFSIRREALTKALEKWNEASFDPEEVIPLPAALSNFVQFYYPVEEKIIVLHVSPGEMSAVLVEQGAVLGFYSEPISSSVPASLQVDDPELMSLKRTAAKMCYSLVKEIDGQSIKGIVLTGAALRTKDLASALISLLPYPLLDLENSQFPPEKILEYALPIGLGLEGLSTEKNRVNFRVGDLTYPFPWKKLVTPLVLYLLTIFLLTLAFNFFSSSRIHLKEDEVRQSYLDLLGEMNRSYNLFEEKYLSKNPELKNQLEGDIPDITTLSPQQIDDRLDFLQRELQASPDSFPLLPNTPRVSDVLAWLVQHKAVIESQQEEASEKAKLQLDSFNYSMVKRPQQGKKNEHYQVKIELEFSTAVPKWAREFHDALIEPNDLVDPKAEVKWSSNRGKYRTSFFLKDKTSYPGS